MEEEKGLERGELVSTKLGAVIGRHFEFQDSRWNVGLQMADVLANAAQRALNRKLKVAGWGNIGRLMIQRNPNPVQFVQIKPGAPKGGKTEIVKSPFYGPLRLMRKKAKPIWLDPAGEAALDERNQEKNASRMRPGPLGIDVSKLP